MTVLTVVPFLDDSFDSFAAPMLPAVVTRGEKRRAKGSARTPCMYGEKCYRYVLLLYAVVCDLFTL